MSFEQDETGVTSTIRTRDGAEQETVRSDYLVAADGAHSRVRELAGIESAGRGSFAECVTIYFRADMRELIGNRNLSVVYVDHPNFSASSASPSPGTPDSWPSSPRPSPTARGTPTSPLTGTPPDAWTWSGSARPSRHPGRDRQRPAMERGSRVGGAVPGPPVFLTGDAAHVMPPTGGFGGNTGVADAHNLVWKLAAVVQGTAGAQLLDTFDAERRPVSSLTVEQAYTRYVLRVDPSLPKDDMAAPLDDASIELGAVHRSAAVLDDCCDDGAPVVHPRGPGGRPGTRAPHLAVESAGAPASLLDSFGRGFVLLAGPAGQGWCDAAERVSADLRVPLAAHRVAGDGSLVARKEAFPDVYGTGDEGAVVVRPGGVVAWRATTLGDPAADVDGSCAGCCLR